MFCPKCGKEIAEGKPFCSYCGAEVPAAKAPTDASVSHNTPETSSPSNKRNYKPLIVGGICAVVVACLAIGGLLFWNHMQEVKAQEEFDRIHSLHVVSLEVNAPGYTPGATRIPVQVQGANADGSSVYEIQFVDGSGQGLQLMQGSYVVSFPASPLLEDGSLYVSNQTTVNVSVDNNLQSEEPVDAKNPVVEFVIEESLLIAEEQINRAHDYAIKDVEQDPDGAKAEALTAQAIDKRNQAIAGKQAADAAAKAAAEAEAAAKKAACHFDAGAFYLDVPESWYGRWTTTETGEDRRPSNGGAMLGGKNLLYTFYLDGTKMFEVAKSYFSIGGYPSEYSIGDSSQVFMPSAACPAEDANYIRNSLVFTGINPNEGTS